MFNQVIVFSVCANVKDDGLNKIKLSKLHENYPHLKHVKPAKYRYANV